MSDVSFQAELAGILGENDLPALVDGIFSDVSAALYPLPSKNIAEKLNISPETCKKYSAVRVTVEWTIGHLKRWFPDAFCKEKMTSATNPAWILRAAVILYNFVVCLRGCQVPLYSQLNPFGRQSRWKLWNSTSPPNK